MGQNVNFLGRGPNTNSGCPFLRFLTFSRWKGKKLINFQGKTKLKGGNNQPSYSVEIKQEKKLFRKYLTVNLEVSFAKCHRNHNRRVCLRKVQLRWKCPEKALILTQETPGYPRRLLLFVHNLYQQRYFENFPTPFSNNFVAHNQIRIFFAKNTQNKR